jgi:hypothetical protein
MNHDQCWLGIGWHVKIIDFSLKLLLRVQNQKIEFTSCWGCRIATIFHLSMNVFKVLWLHFEVASCVMKTFMHKFISKVFWNVILFLPLWVSISCSNLWMSSKCFVHHCLVFFGCMPHGFEVLNKGYGGACPLFFIFFKCHKFGTKVFEVNFTYQD